MKKNLTEMVFILDKSGSMAPFTEDTIGGFNSLIEEQKQDEGDAIVSLVLFNNMSDVLLNRVDIKCVESLTNHDYVACENTALMDSVSSSILHMFRVYEKLPEDEVPEHTIFVIITDGKDNSSQYFDSWHVRHLIENAKGRGWRFMFLGANFDVESAAERYGIDREMAVRYHADQRGTRMNYSSVSSCLSSCRRGRKPDDKWRKIVEEYCEEQENGKSHKS